jgi:hypothetical protein
MLSPIYAPFISFDKEHIGFFMCDKSK